MHIPSARIYNEIRSEQASLWFTTANLGEEVAFLAKIPTPTIKALISGCDSELVIGIKENYLVLGIRIFDVPEHPVLISKVIRSKEEISTFSRILREEGAPIFLFNEMDICVASSYFKIKENTLISSLDQEFYCYELSVKCTQIHDEFSCLTDSVFRSDERFRNSSMKIDVIKLELSIWDAHLNSFAGFRESHSIEISRKEEGDIFENMIWCSLESVFNWNIYKSPQVKLGDNKRELTDIFSFYECGVFFIEAKDLSVIQAGYLKSQEKRINSVQKQIKKAIAQLKGSVKAFRNKSEIFDSAGNDIIVNRALIPHAIILITELMHVGDWSEISDLILNTSKSSGILFHLIDLVELIEILKSVSGDPYFLDYTLVKRFEKFIDCKSVHLRLNYKNNLY